MKKIILLLMSSLLLVSCGMIKNSMYLDQNVRKLEQGMTKKEVVSVMGKHYKVLEGFSTPQGFNEVIAYFDTEETFYSLRFLEGKLDGWSYEKVRKQPRPPHRH